MNKRTAVFVTVLVATMHLPASAQDADTRSVTPEEFVKARPQKPAASPAAHATYKQVSGPVKSAASGDVRQMGITIWRLRPSTAADGGPRILVQEKGQEGAESVSWTPQRIASGSPMREGERVRISIESPSTGYLYVIDREQYAGGKLGDPWLIFPTTRIHNGDNQVTAGKLIEVPSQPDRPNYFTLHKSKPDQTGEQLTVVVSQQPLQGISVGAEAQQLQPEQVAGWEKKWTAQTQRFEMVGGVGRAWTQAEQQAGLDGTRLLTQDDPGPQTIYRVTGAAGQPFFAQVELGYSAPRGHQ
jgi:hypothetical protein